MCFLVQLNSLSKVHGDENRAARASGWVSLTTGRVNRDVTRRTNATYWTRNSDTPPSAYSFDSPLPARGRVSCSDRRCKRRTWSAGRPFSRSPRNWRHVTAILIGPRNRRTSRHLSVLSRITFDRHPPLPSARRAFLRRQGSRRASPRWWTCEKWSGTETRRLYVARLSRLPNVSGVANERGGSRRWHAEPRYSRLSSFRTRILPADCSHVPSDVEGGSIRSFPVLAPSRGVASVSTPLPRRRPGPVGLEFRYVGRAQEHGD